jgi:hypothetical protein
MASSNWGVFLFRFKSRRFLHHSSRAYFLCAGGLESKALGALLEGDAELKELDNDGAEVLEEGVVVLGVLLDVGLHGLVLNEGNVGGQHHQGLALVLELLGAVPLADSPLVAEEQGVVVVGHNGRGEGPGAVEAGAVGVATAEGVGASEGDDLLVVETHAVKDIAQVLGALGGIRQTAIRSAGGDVSVSAARSPRDGRTLHLLNGSNTGKGPEIRVGDPRELLCEPIG